MSATPSGKTTPQHELSYRELRPPADLAPVFACFWVKHGAGQPGHQWRTIPNGHSELVWRSANGELTLEGPGRSFTVGGESAAGFTVGMRVRPVHTAWFAGLPAAEVVGRSVPLASTDHDRWRPTASALTEARTPREALIALAAAIRTADLWPRDPDPVVRGGLSQLRRNRRVGDLGRTVHYSEREVRRRFRHETGLGPKTMQRVLRFQQFLALVTMQRSLTLPLGPTAARCGYADQAHLTRECVTMSGLTPRRLLLELSRTCWPHHDHAASFAHLVGSGQTSRPGRRSSSTWSSSARSDDDASASSTLQRNSTPK